MGQDELRKKALQEFAQSAEQSSSSLTPEQKKILLEISTDKDENPFNNPERREHLLEMGRNSGLQDSDLIIGFDTSFQDQFAEITGTPFDSRLMNDLLKGKMAELAMQLGLSPKDFAKVTKEGLDKMFNGEDKGPKFDA